MTNTFEPVDPAAHAPLLHSWMSQEYARFWGMLDASVADVEKEYAGIAASPNHEAWLGVEDGRPVFLMERYDPSFSPLAGKYEEAPGDVGMHLLVSPPQTPRSGFTTAVMRSVLAFLFADPAVSRVVVEPDIRNTKIAALNARLGFEAGPVLSLPDKTAQLGLCTRAQFHTAIEGVRP